MLIRVSDLELDPGAQPRAEMDLVVIEDYATALRAGDTFPPIVVFFDGKQRFVADGFHRVYASREAGVEKLKADVREGTLRDAILFSVGTNAAHGLRRTNADKRRAVLMLLEDPEWGVWSDMGIARRCAVSDRFVNNLRAELSSNGSKIETKKVSRGGTEYEMDTSKIGTVDDEPEDETEELPLEDDPRFEQLEVAYGDADIQEKSKKIRAKKAETRRRKKLGLVDEIRNEPQSLPKGPFRVIVIDPPWKYTNRVEDDSHRGRTPYPDMSIEEICDLPVSDLAHDDCVLFLWVTNAFMKEAFLCLEAWGFSDKTILTWDKVNIGLGDWLRNVTEHCILAVKGKPIVTLTNQTTLLREKRTSHSRKPEEFYKLVDELCPGSKLEMFARVQRDGWQSWGTKADVIDE